jgi:hypothetical protein
MLYLSNNFYKKKKGRQEDRHGLYAPKHYKQRNTTK